MLHHSTFFFFGKLYSSFNKREKKSCLNNQRLARAKRWPKNRIIGTENPGLGFYRNEDASTIRKMLRIRVFWFTVGLATTGAVITKFSLRDLWTDFSDLSYDVSLFLLLPLLSESSEKIKTQNTIIGDFLPLKIVKIRFQNSNLILVKFFILSLILFCLDIPWF